MPGSWSIFTRFTRHVASGGRYRSMNPQPADPAIRKNVQAYVRNRTNASHLSGIEMTMARAQLRPGQELRPGDVRQRFDRHARRKAPVDRGALRIVALEVIRVDLHFANKAWRAQPHYRPIVSGPAAAPCFPPIAHVPGAGRHDHVVLRAEVHVA